MAIVSSQASWIIAALITFPVWIWFSPLIALVGFVVYYFFVRPLPPKQVQKRSLVTKERVICNAAHPELVDTVFDNVKTLDGQFRVAAEKYGDSPCLGYRRELGIKPIKKFVPIDGKMVEKSFNIVQKERAVRYQTFSEVYAEIRALGAGLADTGMKFGQRLSLYSDTRAEWQKTAQACFAYGFPVVTSYSSLGPEALSFSLHQSKSTHVMTNAKLLPVLFKCLVDNKCPSVRVVVYTDAASASVVDPFVAATQGAIKLISYEELVAAGRTSKTQPQRLPQPTDVAVIMYTSGSTGNPKGVVINHHSLIAAGAGAANCVVPPLSTGDTYIAFLPLAHVLELMAECGMLAHGVAVAYSNPQQLTDEFVEDENGKPCGDFQAIRPTISAAVPLLMDRMRKGVLDKVAKSKIGSLIFHTAFAIKRRRYLAGLSSWLLDKVVFSKLHAVLGGRIRVMMSGGAPLNAETQEFMNIVFCVPIGQGYGSTETCGGGTVTVPEDVSTANVGPPLTSTRIRLVDVPEMGYLWSDLNEQGQHAPRGEIWIGGTPVAVGYFEMPEKTAEDFCDEMGLHWFKTGDIGRLNPDGTLSIVDRKKDLIKLSGGEYIALGAIEAVLKALPFVDNICVYGDSLQQNPVAVLVPNRAKLLALATNDVGLAEAEAQWPAVCEHEKVKSHVLKQVAQFAKSEGLKPFEIITNAIITTDEWTIDNGMLTDAMKLKRAEINKKYKPALQALYAQQA